MRIRYMHKGFLLPIKTSPCGFSVRQKSHMFTKGRIEIFEPWLRPHSLNAKTLLAGFLFRPNPFIQKTKNEHL